eukprot:m.332240 g.332240  ORF g.332240 m.332240 type:complete len:196 (+) comp16906_c0_seq1:622-1209(+)
MADHPAEDDLVDEGTAGYKPPEKVALDKLKDLDKDDDALNRWKAQLLQGAEGAGDGPNVQVLSMKLKSPGHDDIKIDLTGDLSALKSDKSTSITIKEGVEFQIEIEFKVNKDLVSGLKYMQAVYRKGIRVDKSSYMLGSYGPKGDAQKATTKPPEIAPSGMLARGHYSIKSRFIDDDGEAHLEWTWQMDIKKDWA